MKKNRAFTALSSIQFLRPLSLAVATACASYAPQAFSQACNPSDTICSPEETYTATQVDEIDGDWTLYEFSSLVIEADDAIAPTATIQFKNTDPNQTQGGMLQLNGYNTQIGRITGEGTIAYNGSTDSMLTITNPNDSISSFSGSIYDGLGTGKLGLTLNGGTLILSGTNNSYRGNTIINGGTLQIALGSLPPMSD